ncbi:C2H2-type zinc finger protein [Pseudomonas aeruginosa]|uniref:C2H2-type zinc finger protein n=1 Tax=Pseudomonas aeruginosa TaxID=287 RepID=UPI003457B6F9
MTAAASLVSLAWALASYQKALRDSRDEKHYHCPICQQRFKRKDRMSYHVRSHQGGVEKPYVCPHCAKGFSR